mgnify:CR=1 FL=1
MTRVNLRHIEKLSKTVSPDRPALLCNRGQHCGRGLTYIKFDVFLQPIGTRRTRLDLRECPRVVQGAFVVPGAAINRHHHRHEAIGLTRFTGDCANFGTTQNAGCDGGGWLIEMALESRDGLLQECLVPGTASDTDRHRSDNRIGLLGWHVAFEAMGTRPVVGVALGERPVHQIRDDLADGLRAGQAAIGTMDLGHDFSLYTTRQETDTVSPS